ncbi:hypothetical protein JVU11DRAFT_9074 [Chiua virens]|nr:hypothetical protein JVU11DRAFT_9074 [Chiua virens]
MDPLLTTWSLAALFPYAVATTCQTELVLSNAILAPDGFDRRAIVVNGEAPGSLIMANKNHLGSSFQGDGTIHEALGNTRSFHPKTALVDGEAGTNAALSIPGGFTQVSLVNSATGAAAALAGWAMSSLRKKLSPSDLQSTIAVTTNVCTPPTSTGSALTGSDTDVQSRSTDLAQPKGLQLGGSKTNGRSMAQLAE